MKAVSIDSGRHLAATPKPGILDGIARRIVLGHLERLRHGRVTLRDGDEERVFGEANGPTSLWATIDVHDPLFYGDIAFGGSIGAGEAWMRGSWNCDDLVSLVRKEIGAIASPDVIQWAPGLPKTRSGKIMRRILRKVAENELGNLGDTSTLAEPAVVDDLIANRANQ